MLLKLCYLKSVYKRYFFAFEVKRIYLSKALTCMKKQELLFCQGDGYLWLHCCMNNLNISQRSILALTYSFWAIRSMLISLFRVTSWFYTVYNVVTRWTNFRKTLIAWTWTTIIRLHYLEVFSPKMYTFLVEKYIFLIFACEFFKIKLLYCE